MKAITKLAAKDREALFRNTASKLGIAEAIIEKDFWVCWVLDYLFHTCKWKDHFAFKGGTSLSKAYDLIRRFSEDVDLILDWRVLGFGYNEPWDERSKTKQDAFNKDANQKAECFLANEFLPVITEELSSAVNGLLTCEIDSANLQTVKIMYPKSFSDPSILHEIRLEIGALAPWTPVEMKAITPYAAIEYGNLFKQPSTQVLTLLPKRTFWEKATILHREAYRGPEKEFPARYSRHYYDLYCMMHSPIQSISLEDIELLFHVTDFKSKFYQCAWARYDLIKAGEIRLLPPEHNVKRFMADYDHMQNMIFGEKPDFPEIINDLGKLEEEIREKILIKIQKADDHQT